ncbi:MAG TPA: MBL fold metallo-hydrolase [Rubricoccaceae bacterium]|jgi:glyoxylase-like metal-dependent hydrolase (beta-lactamase superfamily II)
MPLRLTLLTAGFCTAPEAAAVAGGRWRTRRFPAGIALIEGHDAGPVLFDTGYAPRIRDATRRFPYRFYRWATPMSVRQDETAAAQLAARGIAPDALGHVVLSHLHADHVGGLRDFPNAAIHVLPEAVEAVRGRHGVRAVRAGILPQLLPDDLAARVHAPERRVALPAGLAPFRDGVDLFGDGQMLGIPLPGHAPGQMGLYLEPAGGPPTLLAADAAWTLGAIRDNAPLPRLGRAVLHDAAATRETQWRLHRLMAARPDLRVVLSHDAP